MTMNGLVWETNHQGKMKGIPSISTSCATNPHCIKRRENGDSVCSHCYAATYLKMRKSLKNHLEENTEILTTRFLKANEIPVTNSLLYRFESFGDLHNTTHLRNYIEICKRNPYTRFALWTKNVHILEEVFDKYKIEKPNNLSIVLSSPILNMEMKIDQAKCWYIDHVFTVYNKDYIKKYDVDINCGAKDCLGCQLCYNITTDFYIREKLK